MDIDKLARKLEPLLPKQVERWLSARDRGDAEIRSLIDSQIMATAQRMLGDYRNKILLSLPGKGVARGTYPLGTVLYDKPRWPVGISANELMQNLAIFGRSGAGKTNVAFLILQQLADRKIPFVFLDWKRTARHLLPHFKRKVTVYTPGRPLAPLRFNPFVVPPGLEQNVYVTQLVDVMADAYTLGDGARRLLQQAISDLYGRGQTAPTSEDILNEISRIPDRERVRGWKISAERALASISFSQLTTAPTTTAQQEERTRALAEESTIIELDALDQGGKKFLIPTLCLWLYHVKLAAPEREQLSLVIFVEEAHHVLYRHEHRAKEGLMNMLLRQCRELGIGVVVIDQHPHLVSSAALGNTYTTICLNQKDPSDISRAAGLSLVEEAEKRYFSLLPVGQGIVKLQDRWRRPVLVQFPLVSAAKGAVTDELLRRYVAGDTTLSEVRRAVVARGGHERGSRVGDKVLDRNALAFLEDVTFHPEDGVDARYKRLGWSVDKGNRLKAMLIADRWLESAFVKSGRTHRMLLRLSPTAERWFEPGTKAGLRRGSLEHEYWKQFYARLFRQRGYTVQLEVDRNGGRADVIARKQGESVAIEVETGKSDVVANVRRDLQARIGKVLVVATDDTALKKMERQLARAGLLIRGRIEIVARDKGTLTLERA